MKTLKRILMGLAAVVGFTTAAQAATPVAVWDGDFTTATKGDWTLSSTGSTITDASVTIGTTPLTIAHSSDVNTGWYTVVYKVKGLLSTSTTPLATFGRNTQDAGYDNANMLGALAENNTPWGIWSGAKRTNTPVTQLAMGFGTDATVEHKIVVRYHSGANSGAWAYVDGTKCFLADSGLKATISKFNRFTVLGYYNKANDVLTDAVVTAIAIFSDSSDAGDAAYTGYIFPSDLTTHKATVEAGGEWDWTALSWNPEITNPSLSKLELTIAAEDAIFTMDENPNCYSLDVTGTMKIKVDAEGEDVAKKTAVGAPYADWLFKTTATVMGTFEPVFNSALPAGYTASYEIVAGQGVRYVVTAPAWAKFGSVNINFAGGRQGAAMVDDSKVGSLTTLIGAQPVIGTSWNDLGAANQTDTAVSKYVKADGTVVEDANITLTASQVNNPYTSGAAANMLITGYMDDSKSPIVQIGNIPFSKYRVILYRATDSGSTTFSAAQIGTTSSDAKIYYGPTSGDETGGATVSGTTETVWGKSDWRSGYAEGVNYIVSDVLEGTAGSATAYIYSHKHAGRAGVAAIQIVEVGEVIEETEYTATINKDTNWNEIQWSPEPTDGFPVNAKLVLTAEDNPTLTFTTIENIDRPVVINGAVTLKAADDLYVDGCWETAIATFASFMADDVTFVGLKSGFNGAYTQTATGFNLRAQNKEVISINIAGGSGGGTGADSPTDNIVSGDGFYGIAPTIGDSWNNINRQWQNGGNQTIEIHSPLAYDGATTIQRPTMSLSATGKNTWQCGSIANPFLRGYLDDGNGVTVIVHGVPYTKYDVIVYTTSDSAVRLAPVTINGTTYTYVDGELTEGDAVWGVGQYATPEIGKNAIRINNCSGEQLTVNATRHSNPDGRATICAVQVINKDEVVVTREYVGVMDGDVEWTDGAEDEHLESLGDAWENGEYNSITITNTAENATFTFTQLTEGLKFKVVSEEGCALTIPAKSMAEVGLLKTYDFTEAAGGVTIQLLQGTAFDPSTLPLIEGDWKFSKTGLLVYDGKFPTAAEQAFFQDADAWNGKVWFKNIKVTGNVFNDYGNANSKLRFTGVKGWFNYNKYETTLPIELVDEGETRALEVTDGSLNKAYVFDKITGEGTINVSSVHTDPFIVQIKDVSEFEGKITSLASTTPSGDATTPFPILVGETTGSLPYGSTSKITFADGVKIKAQVPWEAESAEFGATLWSSSPDEILSGLTMEEPVYLATKVTVQEEETLFALSYNEDDGEIKIVEAVGFWITPGENATVTEVLGAYEFGGMYFAANKAPIKVTFTAKENYIFPSSGERTLTVEAEAAESTAIEPTEQPVLDAEAKIVYLGMSDKFYLTLQEAFDDAEIGDDVELLKDVDVTESGLTVAEGKDFKLYLADHTITAANTEVGHIQINGTLYVYSGTKDNEKGSGEGQIVSGEGGTYGLIQLCNNKDDYLMTAFGLYSGRVKSEDSYGIVLKGTQSTFFMEGGTVEAYHMAIMSHGSKSQYTTINIQGGTVTSTHDYAIYGASYGSSISISDGTVEGAAGAVLAKAGNLTIDGGTLSYTGGGDTGTGSDGTTGASNSVVYITPVNGKVEASFNGGEYDGEPILTYVAGTYDADIYKATDLDIPAPAGYYWDNRGNLAVKQPSATVEEITPAPEGLDVAYKYTANDTSDDTLFGDWKADFYVSFDKDVKAGVIQLKGQYDAYGENWVTLDVPATAAETEIALVKDLWKWDGLTYAFLCDTVKTFKCGALSINNDEDIKMTVELRLTKEGEKDIVIDTKTYTFDTKLVEPTVAVTEYSGELPEGLDTAYTYTMTDQGKGYDDWNVDYFVSFDNDIAADTVTLKGQYGEYGWQGSALPATTAGTEIQLVAGLGKTINVAELAAIGAFNCGAGDTGANAGTTMTVTLKMFKGSETITLDTQTYTFESKFQPLDPTQSDQIECEDEDAATLLAAAITANPALFVKAPEGVTGEDATAYQAMFQGRSWRNYAFIELNDAAIETLLKEVNESTVTESIAAALVDPTVDTVTITTTTPGFYYWVQGSDTPDFWDSIQGEAKMSTSTTKSFTLKKPEMIRAENNKQFYQIGVGTMDPKVDR